MILSLVAAGCGANQGDGAPPATLAKDGAHPISNFYYEAEDGGAGADELGEPGGDDIGEVPPAQDDFGTNDGLGQPGDDGLGEVPSANDDMPPDGSAATDPAARNVNDTADTATEGASAEAAADAEAAAEAEAADMDAYVVRDARCRFPAPDPDRDGLCNALEQQYGTDPLNPDTDGDGLGDGMEVRGYRIRRTREAILLPDANPLHKDIYVEIDYTPDWRPSDAAIQDVKNAFAAAPIKNKDGTSGIALHVEIDDAKPLAAGLDDITFPDKFSELKVDNFNAMRGPAYHYAIFARQHNGSGSSGIAQIVGVDVVVTLGDFENTQIEQAGTFMHELGHNLGLDHGGLQDVNVRDGTNYKPNYFSIMNYTYQTSGVPRADGTLPLDFSRAAVGQVSEASLSEATGFAVSGTDANALAQYAAPVICLEQVKTDEIEDCSQFFALSGNPTGNLDFNLNYCIDPGTIAADLDGWNGASDTFSAVLDDWTHLDYGGDGVIGNLRKIGAIVRTVERPPTSCMTANTARALSRVVIDNPTPPLCTPTAVQ